MSAARTSFGGSLDPDHARRRSGSKIAGSPRGDCREGPSRSATDLDRHRLGDWAHGRDGEQEEWSLLGALGAGKGCAHRATVQWPPPHLPPRSPPVIDTSSDGLPVASAVRRVRASPRPHYRIVALRELAARPARSEAEERTAKLARWLGGGQRPYRHLRDAVTRVISERYVTVGRDQNEARRDVKGGSGPGRNACVHAADVRSSRGSWARRSRAVRVLGGGCCGHDREETSPARQGRVGVTLVASHASPRFRPLAVGVAGQSLHNLVRCEPVPQSQTPDRRDRDQIVLGRVL